MRDNLEPKLHLFNGILLNSEKAFKLQFCFLSSVFERKDGSSFLDKWIPIIYQVTTSGFTLNQGELISSNLDLQLKKSQKEHQFFMSSYLLDVMCASIEYPSLGWKWKPNLLLVHVYCKILRDYFLHFTKFCLVKKHHVCPLKGRRQSKNMVIGI